LATRRRSQVFSLYKSKIFHSSISGPFDLMTLNVFYMLCSTLDIFTEFQTIS